MGVADRGSLFASVELGARIERAECQLVRDGVASGHRRRPGSRAFVADICGGVAAFAGEGSPFNKVAGLGFGGALRKEEIAAIEAMYDEARCPVQAEVSTLGDAAVCGMLTGRGYRLVGFEDVLGCDLSRARPARDAGGVCVRRCDDGDLDAWLRIVIDGFLDVDSQGVASHESFGREVMERAIGDIAESPGVARFVGELDGVEAGGGSMRFGEGVAQLCGAATLPAWRRRGVQAALLGARLEAARELGCDLAVVTTLPGSKSQENVLRHGFERLYSRAVLVREPGAEVRK